MLDQPEDVVGAIAEVHDVPNVLDVDAVAELGGELVADEFKRAAEAGGGGAVAAHADLDRVGHFNGPVVARIERSEMREAFPRVPPIPGFASLNPG